MTESAAAFRDALSRFASGVTVVAAHGVAEAVGFTASAFSSVSLDPPLVLVCVAKSASAYDGILGATHFGISILRDDQAWLAERFARHGIDRFERVDVRAGRWAPLVEGAIVHLECRRHALHDAGDHSILVGAVLHASTYPGRPLVHHARLFGGFVTGGGPEPRDGDPI